MRTSSFSRYLIFVNFFWIPRITYTNQTMVSKWHGVEDYRDAQGLHHDSIKLLNDGELMDKDSSERSRATTYN